jgi:hypothetical protein
MPRKLREVCLVHNFDRAGAMDTIRDHRGSGCRNRALLLSGQAEPALAQHDGGKVLSEDPST